MIDGLREIKKSARRTSSEPRDTLLRTSARARAVPPLLPVLAPVVIAAIVAGLLLAWWFPPAAPGTVAPAVRFADVTREGGLAGWTAFASPEAPTTLGGGVVCFDYDGDGNEDLLFVGGAPWPWEEAFAKRASRGSLALYRNDGHGRFVDVTLAAGLNVELQGMAAAAGDYDDDGLTDIFVTCVGPSHLFRNLGRGRFEDVTDRAGVAGAENTWSTGACWIDCDNDGRLDLVVGYYARWPLETELSAAFAIAVVGRSYGAPAGFVGAFPSVYRNLGDGRFAPLSGGAGLRDVDPETGFPKAKTLAVAPVDANGDGKLDLLFTYHASEAALFVNRGDGMFQRWAGEENRREGLSVGLASASSLPFDETVFDPRFAAFREVMRAADTKEERFVRLPAKAAVALFDYDLDGRVDVFSGEGRAEPDTNHFDEAREFSAAPVLWWNRGGGWVATAPADGEAWAQPVVARGIATADFDRDGDFDVVLAQQGGAPRLLRNEQKIGSPWLQVELVAKRGPRAGYGARVEVHTPRRVHVRTVLPAMSYMAQSTTTLLFGLGEDARVRRVVVHWPGGTRQEVRPENVNRKLAIAER